MAVKSSALPKNNATRFNPTAQAIIASAVIAVIAATLVTGNPFRAVRLAYLDYSHTPATGAANGNPAPTKDDPAVPSSK
jgi:hypothetical protein